MSFGKLFKIGAGKKEQMKKAAMVFGIIAAIIIGYFFFSPSPGETGDETASSLASVSSFTLRLTNIRNPEDERLIHTGPVQVLISRSTWFQMRAFAAGEAELYDEETGKVWTHFQILSSTEVDGYGLSSRWPSSLDATPTEMVNVTLTVKQYVDLSSSKVVYEYTKKDQPIQGTTLIDTDPKPIPSTSPSGSLLGTQPHEYGWEVFIDVSGYDQSRLPKTASGENTADLALVLNAVIPTINIEVTPGEPTYLMLKRIPVIGPLLGFTVRVVERIPLLGLIVPVSDFVLFRIPRNPWIPFTAVVLFGVSIYLMLARYKYSRGAATYWLVFYSIWNLLATLTYPYFFVSVFRWIQPIWISLGCVVVLWFERKRIVSTVKKLNPFKK